MGSLRVGKSAQIYCEVLLSALFNGTAINDNSSRHQLQLFAVLVEVINTGTRHTQCLRDEVLQAVEGLQCQTPKNTQTRTLLVSHEFGALEVNNR